MRVEVYRNLHNGMWSVRSKKTGRVIAHMNEVFLKDCVFKVREGGRQKVLREKQKNVHAFIEGDLMNLSKQEQELIYDMVGFGVTYNPYKFDSFVIPMQNDTFEPIKKSMFCYMDIENKRVLV